MKPVSPTPFRETIKYGLRGSREGEKNRRRRFRESFAAHICLAFPAQLQSVHVPLSYPHVVWDKFRIKFIKPCSRQTEWRQCVQRPTKNCANLAKQDPSRARQKSQARAGTNFSHPRTSILADLCTVCKFCLNNNTHFVIYSPHTMPMLLVSLEYLAFYVHGSEGPLIPRGRAIPC